MRSFNGPLGPLSVTMAAALFVLAGSTPADAQGPDDDDRPTKEPAPIVTPVQRAAPPIATTPWTRPAQGRITQRFGPTSLRVEPARVVDGVYYAHYHDGLDIGAEMYSPVVAAAPGIVTFVGSLTDGAEVVFIAHAGGYVTEYGHLDNYVAPPNVAVGDIVSAGQVIGRVGTTGNTTGPHLHLEVWHDGALVDPLTLMSR